jgi:hypothetical protein
MSIFSAPSFYAPVDREFYDQGFTALPQSKFTFGINLNNNPPTTNNSGIRTLPVASPRTINTGGGALTPLKPDDRGLITTGSYNKDTNEFNIPNFDFNERYSYTPQGITVEDLTKNRDGDFAITAAPPLENQSGYIKPAPEIFEPQKPNIFSKGFDLAKTAGSGLISLATGIPFVGPLLERGLGAISSQFENRPLGAAVIDEFGNVYDEDELNSMNALGGYYTDAARSARRRTARIQNMLERQRLNKNFSLANLQRLQAQEQKQEEIRKAAARALQDENRDRNRGGYGLGYSDAFMEGDGGRDAAQESRSPGSSGPGGSDTMGSFAYGGRVPYMMGGLTNLVDIYD